jgi:hypothetical protein
MLAILLGMGHRLSFPPRQSDRHWEAITAIFDRLEHMHLNETTKLFAAPNDHLILTFYSGLPIQDISPVKKSYLDSYHGDIVYIDGSISVNTGELTPERIRKAALGNGCRLSIPAAREWSTLLRTRDYREEMTETLTATGSKQLEPLPAFAQQLLNLHHQHASYLFYNFGLEVVIRGFDIRTWSDWRAVLKYRFVNPAAHRGVHANYAERLRSAKITFLPQADAVLYHSQWSSPALSSSQINAIDFLNLLRNDKHACGCPV